MTKCETCKKPVSHPVRRGRKAKYCSEKCRVKGKKKWRKEYDALPRVRGKKAARAMVSYWAAKTSAERRRLVRNRIRRERRMQAGKGV